MNTSSIGSTSQTFQFNFQLGPDLIVTQASVSVYVIKADSALLLTRTVVYNEFFELTLPVEDLEYAYISAHLEEYTFQGSPVSVGDRNLQLLSVFDSQSTTVALSERATIANLWCFARFTTINEDETLFLHAPSKEAAILYGMKNNFCLTDGTLSEVIQNSPNGLETNSYPLYNFLSNLWYYAITDTSIYDSLLQYASVPQAANTLYQAFLNLVYFPFTSVGDIYGLIDQSEQVYTPSLPGLSLPSGNSPIPNQWTLAIKCNDSGAQNFLISGPGYVAFDKNDRAWITNNTRQGTPNSSSFCVVLEPDGSPADFSPLFGGGLLGGGFGVCTDHSKEKIYLGNFGWGPVQCNPQTGSISVFDQQGNAISPPQGYTNKVMRAQGMIFDRQGNLWISSWGTQAPLAPSKETVFDFDSAPSAIVCYPGGDPEAAVSYPFPNKDFGTFDVAADTNGNVFVANAGSPEKNIPSSVYKFRLENGEIVELGNWVSDFEATNKKTGAKTYGLESFRQITLNENQDVFVTGIKSSRIVKLDNDLNFITAFTNKLHAPWGVIFDKQGTLFAANFSREPENNSNSPALSGNFGVTLIYNEDDNSAQFMTLPTGGEGVTLANGFPLYGNNAPACYEPLLRMTATRVDRVGNLWAINNWKPSAFNDLQENPGGDGVVIFVGVASPGGVQA